MNNFNIIYLILPFLLYSLQLVILTKYSRKEGSMQIVFYRQLGIALIGIPLFYFFPINFNILFENINFILFTSLIGSIFLYIKFKSLNYIPVAIQGVVLSSSRIIITILTGVLLLSNKINIFQGIGILFLLLGILTLLKKEKFEKKGIYLSVIGGILLTANWYYFSLYSKNFNPLIAGYILEFFNGLFLFLILITKSFGKNNSIKKSLKIKQKTFLIILISSPLPLIGSGAMSKSYEIYDFTIVGVLLTMTIPMSMIFGYLILKEKLSKKAILSIAIITLSIIMIKYFG